MALKDHARKVRDLLMIDPRVIIVQPGFNVRIPGPALEEHLASLETSIRAIGVQNPLTVRLQGDKVVLVDGHCRLTATLRAIEAGAPIEAVPCVPEGNYVSEADRTLMLLTRNSGKQLETLEKAEVFRRLISYGWAEEQIAEKVGLSTKQVENVLKLSAAPEEIKKFVAEGQVSATTAINVLREVEDSQEAAQTLAQAVETARSRGRQKAMPKDVRKPPASDDDQKRRLSKKQSDDIVAVLREILNVDDVKTIHTMVRDALITNKLN